MDGTRATAATEAGSDSDRALAFRRLADQHLEGAYRLACAIVHDRAEAEDATHDAFVTAWRSWGSLRDQSKFEHWFDRILINICRNRLRRAGRIKVQEIRPDLPLAAPDQPSSLEARDELADAIASLSPDHRTVLALRYYSDLTVEQIAERLGIRNGTVKSRLHYALRALQRRLGRAGNGGRLS